MYNSKSGSKSFDELDDLLSSESKTKKPKKSKNTGGNMHENNARHSCDELMMTRSLYETETSDTGSQVSSKKSLEYLSWVVGLVSEGKEMYDVYTRY